MRKLFVNGSIGVVLVGDRKGRPYAGGKGKQQQEAGRGGFW